jgi:hypothetical protein
VPIRLDPIPIGEGRVMRPRRIGANKCPARRGAALSGWLFRKEKTPWQRARYSRRSIPTITCGGTGWQKERVRKSLGTPDLKEARRRRDELLARYPQIRQCELSLRLQPPRRRCRMDDARPQPQPFAA